MQLKSISAKLSLLTSALILVTMVCFVMFVYNSTYTGIMKGQVHNMKQLNKQLQKTTDDFLSSSLAATKALLDNRIATSNIRSGKATSLLSNTLNDVLKNNPLYSSVIAFDVNGKVLGAADTSGDDLAGTSLEDPNIVPHLQENDEYIGTKIFRDKTTGDLTLYVAVAVKHFSFKTFIGGYAVGINWSAFSKRYILDVLFGSAGYPFVLDSEGKLVSHPDANRLLRDLSGESYIQQVMSTSDAVVNYTEDDVDKVLVSVELPKTGWWICGTARVDDLASAALQQRTVLIIAAIIVVLGLAGVLVFSMQRSIFGPMARIRAFTNEVAQGNIHAEMDGVFKNELADLSGDISVMVGELKEKLGFTESILEGMPLPVITVDENEKVIFTNKHCLDLIEADGEPADYYGQSLNAFFYNDTARDTLAGKAIHEKSVYTNVEVSVTGRKGGLKEGLANVTYLDDLDGNIIGAFYVFIDTTEMKRQQKRIEEQNERIAQTALRANDIASQVSSAAEELSAQVDESTTNTDEQRTRTQEAAAAMEQMNASVLEVARNAGSVAEIADTTRVKAQEGADIVDESVTLITKVHEQAMELKADMDELGKQADGIGEIMNVIADIADQTNLLALNAAIEAARAGEAGRGFAVVADEVRKLAEKTMSATSEVGSYIQGIQNSARKSISNTESAAEYVTQSTDMAERSGSALREIVGMIEHTADQVRSIATAAEQQSAASEQVTQSTDEINRIASETAEAMQQSAVAVGELAKLAENLKSLIGEMQS